MLIRDTEAGDVRIAGGVITEMGVGLRPEDDEVDAAGGALIPGLHDHHVHLRALAASRSSIDVGAGLDDLRAATGEWVRGVNLYGDLDRWQLDAVVADRAVRVQHRSGELWVLNSRAAEAVGLPDDHDGRLWRQDEWLRERVPPVQLDLAGVAADAAAMGITGFTDTTPGDEPPPDLPQRVIGLGPRKVLLDDMTLPTVDELAARMAAGPVAVHCVTRVQLVTFLAARPRRGDRIEHAAVVPPELIDELARLGVIVVTQPNFVAERGEQYRTDVDPDDLPSLYRCASLLAAGVKVAFGTDAPFGRPDPWAAMRAAVTRELGPEERVSPEVALRLFLGHGNDPATRRRVGVGEPADLCLLHVPLAVALDELDAGNVRATFVDGQLI